MATPGPCSTSRHGTSPPPEGSGPPREVACRRADGDDRRRAAVALHRHQSGARGQARLGMRPQFESQLPAEVGEVPRFRLGPRGLGPDVAYQVVHDELLLDGNARLNLATFVTTWMDRQADALMAECAPKNLIDKDEYPQTAELEDRCVKIIADLWNRMW